MAGDHDGDTPERADVRAGRDAYAAGRDLHVHLPSVNTAGMPARPRTRRRRRVLAAYGAIAAAAVVIAGIWRYYPVQHGKNHVGPPPFPGPGPLSEVGVQAILDWSAPLQPGYTGQFVIPLRPGYSHASITFSVTDADAWNALCTPDTTLTVVVGPPNNPVRSVTLPPEHWTTTVNVTGFVGSVPVQLTVGTTMSGQGSCPVDVGVPNVTLTNH
jgi:hypothetical protein